MSLLVFPIHRFDQCPAVEPDQNIVQVVVEQRDDVPEGQHWDQDEAGVGEDVLAKDLFGADELYDFEDQG